MIFFKSGTPHSFQRFTLHAAHTHSNCSAWHSTLFSDVRANTNPTFLCTAAPALAAPAVLAPGMSKFQRHVVVYDWSGGGAYDCLFPSSVSRELLRRNYVCSSHCSVNHYHIAKCTLAHCSVNYYHIAKCALAQCFVNYYLVAKCALAQCGVLCISSICLCVGGLVSVAHW